MLIWILALAVLGLMAWFGYLQGGIRAAISFLGLLVAALLAMPLSPIVQKILGMMGMNQPSLRIITAPAIGFLVIVILSKVFAHAIFQKIDLFYRYKVSDEANAKWQRLNQRLGLCVGVLNGAVYFFLLLIPIYIFGYTTVQLASAEEAPAPIRLLNQAREQLHTTKMDRVVAAHDAVPEGYYDASDIVALLFRNPLLESRLWRYPSFLTLAEGSELKEFANDGKFREMWQSGPRAIDFFQHPQVKAILNNVSLMTQIKNALGPDLKDLHQFLETGKSEKYDSEKILGRWTVDLNETINLEKASKPNFSAADVKQLRNRLASLLGANLVVMTDSRILLKRGDRAPGAKTLPPMISEGTWKKEAGVYKATLDGKAADVLIDADKLLLQREGLTLVFQKEM